MTITFQKVLKRYKCDEYINLIYNKFSILNHWLDSSNIHCFVFNPLPTQFKQFQQTSYNSNLFIDQNLKKS